ncbi:MAG TPA: cyclic pyranopterin monophosphate synthase MoaC [Longimicrobiales bacterium]|nr:cyclic pyranopterin monophosphate synthase MoaC [Longimicrobiales bacterium]
MNRLTHVDESGRPRMVDVGDKEVTDRRATAEGRVVMEPATLATLLEGRSPKGDPLAVARIAAIQAAKRTAELIPLCHTLPLTAVDVELTPDDALPGVRITATARTRAQTGVEMESLTAVSVAALTVYDMLKAVDRHMRIEGVRLLRKSGGRSGEWRADPDV